MMKPSLLTLSLALSLGTAAHATEIICTQGGSLSIRDATLKQTLFSAADGEVVEVIGETPATTLVGGQPLNFVEVRFPNRRESGATGWAARNYIRTPEDCEAAGLHDPKDKTVRFNPEDLKNENDWKRRAFDLIVVINRHETGQYLDAYYKGQWVKHTEVSSAKEAYVQSKNLDGSVHTSFAHTPEGYYPVKPYALRIDHHSNEFAFSYMPFAVFFDQDNGLATHQAPPGTEDRLGIRASHGCVRMPREEAIDLFFTVAMTGGPFQPSNFSGECPSKYNYDYNCLAAASRNTENDRRLVSRALELGAAKGLRPYSEMPLIPKVTRYGRPILNPVTNQWDNERGYRTLYILISQPVPKDTPKIPENSPQDLFIGIPYADDACVTIAKKSKTSWGKPQQLLREKCLFEPSGPPIGNFGGGFDFSKPGLW